MMTKWEYAVIPLLKGMRDTGLKTQEDLLEKYGLDGWELVSTAVLMIPHNLEIIAYLKREKK